MIQKELRTDLFTLPNILTYLRIACIPAILFLLVKDTPEHDIIGAILFVFASLTDYVDGWLARRQNSVSRIGMLIDPLADKLLIVSVLIILVHQLKIDPIITVILIWREFGILTLRSVASTQGIDIPASSLAKRKTLFQIVGLFGIMIGKNNDFLGITLWYTAGYVVIILSLFISVLSGYLYLRNYLKIFYDIKKTDCRSD